MKKKILVVEDEPLLLELISQELRFSGFAVKEAICGNEAIDILEHEKFDFVISDYKMPNGNGMTVLNHVQKMKTPPVFIFISAQAEVSVEECLKAGAKRFFSKPFDLDKLIYEIKNISN